jgi:prepilin-type processing-associated H-X9-DG protein
MGALAPMMGQQIRTENVTILQDEISKGTVRRVFVCPSDREGGRYGATVLDGGAGWNSYAFNEAALGWGDPGDGSGCVGHSRLRGHSTRFPHAAQLMLLTDGAPRGGDGAGSWQVYYDHAVDCTLGDIFRGGTPHDCGELALLDKTRHRGRINVGFADGHVENVFIEEGTLEKISLDKDFPIN